MKLLKTDQAALRDIASLSIHPGTLHIHFYETDGGSRSFVGITAKLTSGKKFPQQIVMVRRKFQPKIECNDPDFIDAGMKHVEQVYAFFNSMVDTPDTPVTVIPPKEHFFTLFKEAMSNEQG